jgi:hypothetical protein
VTKILEKCRAQEARALDAWLRRSEDHTTLFALETAQADTYRVARQLQILEEAQQADAYDRRYGKGKYAQRSEASAFIEGVDRGLQTDYSAQRGQLLPEDKG